MNKFVSSGTALVCAVQALAAANFDSLTSIPLPPGADTSFGSAVALSGNTLVVAAPDDDVNGIIGGAVYVFVNTNDSWIQQARLISPQPSDFEFFGDALAIDGDRVVVGSFGSIDTQAGAVYVFKRTGESWAFEQQLVPSDAAEFQMFGTSVGISGDTVAVGSFSSANDATPYSGAVYAFVRNGASWSQQQKIVADPPVTGELLGYSVAVQGDAIAAGAPYADDYAGVAYLFSRTAGVWTQQARLAAPSGVPGAMLGCSIALSGNTILAGAPEETIGLAEQAGSAHVFSFDGSIWSHAKLVAPNPFSRRSFGGAVGIYGDTVVIGAEGERDPFDLFTAREAYVFERSGAVWSELQRLTTPNAPDVQHYFGAGVAISSSRIVVGDVTSTGDSAVQVYDSARNTPPTIVSVTPLQTFTCVLAPVPVSTVVEVADIDGDPLTVVWSVNGTPVHTALVPAGISVLGVTLTNPAVTLPAGTHGFDVSVSDAKAATNCQSIAVLLADTQAPVVTSTTATPNTLKRGNKLMPVAVSVVASDDCSATTSQITQVTWVDSGTGKRGKTSTPEWQITGPLTVNLGTQLSGNVTRVYTITVETKDASGNATTSTATVTLQ